VIYESIIDNFEEDIEEVKEKVLETLFREKEGRKEILNGLYHHHVHRIL